MECIAFDPLTSLIEEVLEQIANGFEGLTEKEDAPEHHTTKLCSCTLLGRIHSNLIPWYTSGFE